MSTTTGPSSCLGVRRQIAPFCGSEPAVPYASDPGAVYMRPLAHVLGRQVSLRGLDDPEVEANLELLASEGVSGAGVSDSTSMELAAAITSSSGGRAMVEGVEPNMVVVCTDTLEGLEPTGWMTRYQHLSRTELTTTLMVSGHACANFVVGLETCRSLIASGAADTVLLVTADRISSGTRYTALSKSVFSDGAAACLVSTEPAVGSLKVLHSGMQGQAAPRDANGGMAEARATLLSMAAATSRALGDGGMDGVRHVLSLNLGKTARALLAMAASVPPDEVRAGSAASLGHCFSADVLLGLEELLAEESCRPGDRILVLTSGRHVQSAISLECPQS